MVTKTMRAPEKAGEKKTDQNTLILNPYETIFVIKPSLSDDDISAVIEKVKSVIEQQGGEIVATENWGKRKLAYEIRNERKGVYVVIHFKGTGAAIQEIEKNYRIAEPIIKYITLKIDPELLGQALPIKEERTFSPRGRSQRNWR